MGGHFRKVNDKCNIQKCTASTNTAIIVSKTICRCLMGMLLHTRRRHCCVTHHTSDSGMPAFCVKAHTIPVLCRLYKTEKASTMPGHLYGNIPGYRWKKDQEQEPRGSVPFGMELSSSWGEKAAGAHGESPSPSRLPVWTPVAAVTAAWGPHHCIRTPSLGRMDHTQALNPFNILGAKRTHTDTHARRHADRQTDRHRDRQTHRQTERQTDTSTFWNILECSKHLGSLGYINYCVILCVSGLNWIEVTNWKVPKLM